MQWDEPDFSASTRDFYDLLTSALPWASADFTKPHLHCAYLLDEGGLCIVTTDGSGLFSGTIPARIRRCNWSVSRDQLETIRKALRPHTAKNAPYTHVSVAYGRLEVRAGDANDPGPALVSFPFPHWDRDNPGVSWRNVVQFNAMPLETGYTALHPKLVARAMTSLSAMSGESVQIATQATILQPVRMDGTCTREGAPAWVILMPVCDVSRSEAHDKRKAPSASLPPGVSEATEAAEAAEPEPRTRLRAV